MKIRRRRRRFKSLPATVSTYCTAAVVAAGAGEYTPFEIFLDDPRVVGIYTIHGLHIILYVYLYRRIVVFPPTIYIYKHCIIAVFVFLRKYIVRIYTRRDYIIYYVYIETRLLLISRREKRAIYA